MPDSTVVPDVAQARVVRAWDQLAPALAELVRQAPDPAAPVRGSRWTVRELTAHLVSGLECYRDILCGGGSSFTGVRAADMAPVNDELIEQVLRRGGDLSEQLERAQTRWRELIGASDLPLVVTYHGGQQMTPMQVAASLLYEPVLHGHDLAITLGRPWPIEPDHVDLILRGLSLVLPKAVVPELAHGFNATYQLRLRGQGTYAFRFEEGELSIGCQYEGRIDCRISADPATYLLVASGRRGLVRPALTGQMIVYGRRPWLANRFAKLVEAP